MSCPACSRSAGSKGCAVARLGLDPEIGKDESRTIYNRTLVVSDLTLKEVVAHAEAEMARSVTSAMRESHPTA
jgi:hypothetical protein